MDLTGKDAPLWSCTIDGDAIPSFPLPFSSTVHRNQYRICAGDNLSASKHTLSIKPSFNSSNSIFWFDYITYTPLHSDELDAATLRILNDDSDFEFGGSWDSLQSSGFDGGAVRQTNTTGSRCKLTFNGKGYSPFCDKLFIAFTRYLCGIIWAALSCREVEHGDVRH
jgi:hypothetical protein